LQLLVLGRPRRDGIGDLVKRNSNCNKKHLIGAGWRQVSASQNLWKAQHPREGAPMGVNIAQGEESQSNDINFS
jgi:hypothetical protein